MNKKAEESSIPAVPVMTKTKFSSETGLRAGQIESQITQGNLPTMPMGKHRLINLVALTQMCIDESNNK